jgi:hypothetical protein
MAPLPLSLVPHERVLEFIDHVQVEFQEGVAAQFILTNFRVVLLGTSNPDPNVGNGSGEFETILIVMPLGNIQATRVSACSKKGRTFVSLMLTLYTAKQISLRVQGSKAQRVLERCANEILWQNAENAFAFRSTTKQEACPYRAGDTLRALAEGSPQWRVANCNAQYELCKTYPDVLVCPASVDDALLLRAAAFRSKQRLPCLTWIHPKNGAPLCRCSQPLAGVTGVQNEHDRALLDAIRESVPKPGPLHIFDCRPVLNAQGNALKGKGFENVEALGGEKKAKLHFLNIGNIHVMRDAFNNVRRSLYDQQYAPDAAGACGDHAVHEWLKHVSLVLQGASKVAAALEDGVPALVHCSDGWDRTAQISALAPLLLDPRCRTVDGFVNLVEKDWCAFGHMFAKRCGAADVSGSGGAHQFNGSSGKDRDQSTPRAQKSANKVSGWRGGGGGACFIV